MSAWIVRRPRPCRAQLDNHGRRDRRMERRGRLVRRGHDVHVHFAFTSAGSRPAPRRASPPPRRCPPGHDVGRQQPHDRLGRAIHEQAARQRAFDDRRGVHVELQAPHQARAANLGDRPGASRPALASRARNGRRHAAPGASRPRSCSWSRTTAPRGTPAGCRHRSCRDRRAHLRRHLVGDSAAPTGTPAPSALPSVTRSGVRPSVWK